MLPMQGFEKYILLTLGGFIPMTLAVDRTGASTVVGPKPWRGCVFDLVPENTDTNVYQNLVNTKKAPIAARRFYGHKTPLPRQR